MEKWCVHYVCGLLVLVQCFLTAVTYYTPVCESPRLCENNNRVCVTCTADGIPSGNRRYYYCSLYSYISPHVQVSPVTANVSYNRVGGYSCTARVLVRNLGPGTHYFKMYLYLSGNTGVLSALTTSISLPVTYTPVCDPPRLCGNNNNRVCVTCTADGIPSGVRGTYFCALYTTRSRSRHPQQIQVSDVTDGVNNNRRAGYSCTASVLVTRLGPGTHYFQMHLYQTGHTGVFSAFSSPISLYGRLAVSVDVSPNPVNICPGTSHDVTVVCSVKFEDTYNEPVFQLYWGGQLKQSTRGTLETNQYSSESYYTLVSKYTVDVNQAGSINFRCEAYNSVHTSEKASSKTITVQVNAPPSTPPKLTISGGVYSGLQGYSISLTPGQTYSASCDVSRGQPPVSSVTLTCPGVSQKTVSGTSVSLSNIPVVKWADQEKCVCAAQHVSQCYNLRTEVTIRVLFPPETVTFERTDRGNISPVDICPDSQPEIPLQCSATSNPQPQFTILVNEQTYSGPLQGQVVKSRTNTYVYSYDFVPEAGGTYNITCTAKGDKTALVESDQLTIFVREPPQTEPKITITSIGPSGNVSKNPEVIYKSIATNATCLVDGGYPPVTSQDILLTCGNLSGSEQITLPPGHSTDGEIACSCSASHITGCYSRSAHTRFNVSALPLSPEASTDNSDVTVVASVGVAVVVVVVIVVVVIVLVFRRRNAHRQKGPDRSARNRGNNSSEASTRQVRDPTSRPDSTILIVDNSELYGTSGSVADLLCSRVINPSFQGHTGTGGERVYQNAKAATTGESTGTGPGKKPKTAPKPTRKATPQAQTLGPASPTSPSSLASLPSDTSGDVYAKVQKLPKTQEMPHPSADVLEDLQGEHVYNNTDGHHEYFSNSSLLGDDKVSPSAPDASLLDDQVYYNTGPMTGSLTDATI